MAPRRWQGLGEIVGMDYDAKPTMLVVPEPPFETHSQNQKKNSFGQFHPICHF